MSQQSKPTPATIHDLRLDTPVWIHAHARTAIEAHFAPRAVPEQGFELLEVFKHSSSECVNDAANLHEWMKEAGVEGVAGEVDDALLESDDDDEDKVPEILSEKYPRPARRLALEICTNSGLMRFYCWRQVVGMHGERWIFENTDGVAYVGPPAEAIGDSKEALQQIVSFWSLAKWPESSAGAWDDGDGDDAGGGRDVEQE
jgi:hypothetical protein